MRSSTAYFAGAGTVIAAIVAGLGGGYLFFSIVSPHPEKHGSSEVTRLERRMPSEPIPAANNASPEPVPYVSAPQISATAGETPPQPRPPQTQPQQAEPQQARPQPAAQAAAPPANPPAAQPVAAVEQPAAREKSAPEEFYARARDADLKRDARRAEEKRKAERERRQQWAERRKFRQRDDDAELRDVERRVREDSEHKPLFASEPRVERIETPRIRLFGGDDD